MPKTKKPPFYKRKGFLWTLGSVISIVLIIALAFRVSPWPGALIIRATFEKNDAQTTKVLEKHTPDTPITVIKDQQYRAHDSDAFLDIYMPSASADKAWPLIIWTHGGAWVSGGREDNTTYYKLLAAQGFAVASLDYTLGPEKTYPYAIHQLNEAYQYLEDNASRLHLDKERIFLAGDSAGSQLSSQMAAIITNPQYAQEMNVSPNLERKQLKGLVLNCGIYKMDLLVKPDLSLPKIVGWGTDVSVWAYTGTRDLESPVLREMSAYYHVTKDFPATYISGGNADPLTKQQSEPMAEKLKGLGVDVTTLFFKDDYQPPLPHEYQFNLDINAGAVALKKTVAFLKEQLKQ